MGRVSWDPGAPVSPGIAWNQEVLLAHFYITSLHPFLAYALCFYLPTVKVPLLFRFRQTEAWISLCGQLLRMPECP